MGAEGLTVSFFEAMSADKWLMPVDGHTSKLIQATLNSYSLLVTTKGRHKVGKNNRVPGSRVGRT